MMLPLSEELRQAIAELSTWARLHQTAPDPGIWQAIHVVEKAQAFVARAEWTHPHSPWVLPDVGPRDVLVFRGVAPDEGGMAETVFDHYAALARAAGAPDTDPVERHAPLIVWLYDSESTVEKMDDAAMAEVGWIRKP